MAARQFVANKFPAKPLQKLTQVHLLKRCLHETVLAVCHGQHLLLGSQDSQKAAMEQDNATKRAASSTRLEGPEKKQRTTAEVSALPAAKGDDVQKIYYERFVEEWQRQENVSIVSALRQPTEFGKISYHAELRLDGTIGTQCKEFKAPRLRLKRPQQNSYSKRCFCRFGSDRFLFVNIPQRLPADFHGSHLQHFDLLGRTFRFLVAKFQSSWAKDAKGAKVERVREDCFEKSWIKSNTILIR